MNLKTEFTAIECAYFRENCNFTPDELEVFNLRVRAMSVIEIAEKLRLSEATVNRRIKGIKRKIIKVL
jgi:DNA-binding NarL/FixJ family response regulator